MKQKLIFLITMIFTAMQTLPYACAEETVPAENPSQSTNHKLSPAGVGWGNLLVPGLGATLRGQPGRGLIEGGIELGTYFGATYGVKEGDFTIDGNVPIPTSPHVYQQATGQMFQELGLKLHMYNTFYHYQQAAIDDADSEKEKSNPQPLYKGDWKDMLSAPFRLKNLESPLVYSLIAVSGVYLVYNYKTTPITPLHFRTSALDDSYYGLSQMAITVGSPIGEDTLFRGFMMREMRSYTKSLALAVIIQDIPFTLMHPDDEKLAAGLSGIYYGLLTEYFHGDLEPSMAVHFWVNTFYSITQYFTFKRLQGKETPFSPPLVSAISIPF